MHLVVKSLIAVIAAAVIATLSFLYSVLFGVPFVEGDRITTEGEADGFRIGMNKAQAFDALRVHYRDKDARVSHVWRRDSSLATELSRFETPQSRQWVSNPHGKYEAAVESLTDMPLPLIVGQRWDVKLPASWVNSVYVTFEDDRVVEIKHSRWLFERP